MTESTPQRLALADVMLSKVDPASGAEAALARIQHAQALAAVENARAMQILALLGVLDTPGLPIDGDRRKYVEETVAILTGDLIAGVRRGA